MAEHTPGPWGFYFWPGDLGNKLIITEKEPGKTVICHMDFDEITETDKANAAFIVKAVNCHDELVGLLKRIVEMATQPLPRKGQIQSDVDDYVVAAPLIKQTKAILAKVTEQP